MTPKYSPICEDPQKYPSSYKKKQTILLSENPQNIEIQNFESPKMVCAFLCMNISESPPPPPGHITGSTAPREYDLNTTVFTHIGFSEIRFDQALTQQHEKTWFLELVFERCK